MSELTPSPKINLLDLSLQDLKDFFASIGEKPFRAVQVFKWIHQRGLTDYDAMTDLSKNLRSRLSLLAEIKAPEIAEEQRSTDGTRKWLMKLADGNQIETVFIPEKTRGTLCVSSQVGCALNCSFCSTATQGFNRNLFASEIIGQVFKAKLSLETEGVKTEEGEELCSSITNVVMMGMGEPLLNFDSVVKAMSIMRDDNAYQLPRRRVTLSTSGIVPKIDELSETSDVSLAVSLHAPFDPLRNELVPINKKYPIHVLMEACRRYAAKDKRRLITMEYVMLDGINDSEMHAKALVKILHNVPCKVNLIPFNPFEGAHYERSSKEHILQFRDIVTRAGFITTTRKTRGDDIDAACGQLKGKVIDRTQRQAKFNQSISQRLVVRKSHECRDSLAKEAVCLGKAQSA